MNIEYLRQFADLVYTKNISQSAARLFLSQSALSKHVASMEQELGTQLFYREASGVELTPAGRSILPYVNRILAAYDHILLETDPNHTPEYSQLRIGHMRNVASELLVSTIRSISRKHPDISIQLKELGMSEIVSALGQNEIELGITLKPKSRVFSSDISFQPLASDQMQVILPPHHPLADSAGLCLYELAKEALILPSVYYYHDYARQLQNYFQRYRIAPHILCEYDTSESAILMVDAGLGVSVLPKSEIFQKNELSTVPLTDCDPLLELCVIWKTDHISPGEKEFISTITQLVQHSF